RDPAGRRLDGALEVELFHHHPGKTGRTLPLPLVAAPDQERAERISAPAHLVRVDGGRQLRLESAGLLGLRGSGSGCRTRRLRERAAREGDGAGEGERE